MPMVDMTTDTVCALVMDEEDDGVPFFTDEAVFLETVFGKSGETWAYFVKGLTAQYPRLVEHRCETEDGYEVLIGSCDAQDILLDAIERCTHDPSLQSFYANYRPNYAGKHVDFKTWFMDRLRSCAGSRIRKWFRRVQGKSPAEVSADFDAIRDKEFLSWQQYERKSPIPCSHLSYDDIGARCTVEKLSACLTDEERSILAVFLNYGGANEEFAAAIEYGYEQARNKMSYICKKMKCYATLHAIKWKL